MKTIIRFFSMLALVGGIAVTGAFAQNACDDLDTPTAQYEKFTGLYQKKTEAEVDEALNTGKAFLEKFGACEAWKEQATFVKAQVTRLEKVKAGFGDAKMFTRFDNAVNSDNTDEIYAAGKEILAKYPDNHNIKYVMAVSVNRELAKKNNKFNADAATYSKALLDGLKSGAIKPNRKDKQGRDTVGVLKYEVPPQDAISELNYTLGSVLYFGQNDKKGGIPYFYATTQNAGFRKEFAPVYATIGSYYVDEAAPIGEQIAKLIETIKTAPDEEKPKIDTEIKAKEALFNGYMERAMDAYARASKFAKTDTPAGQTYKKGLDDEIKRLWGIRFPDKKTGVDEWVAASTAKPLPDPTSAVQPVADPDPTTTTNTTTGAGAGIGAASGKGVSAANGTGVAAKPKP